MDPKTLCAGFINTEASNEIEPESVIVCGYCYGTMKESYEHLVSVGKACEAVA